MATVNAGAASLFEMPRRYGVENLESPTALSTVNPTLSVPLYPSYQFVIYAIRRFNKDHIACMLDPDNPDKQEKLDLSRNLLQSIFNRYHDLTPNARDAVDICLDIYCLLDMCVLAFPRTA